MNIDMLEEVPFISIITINYNCLVDTVELLESIYQCDYVNKEIIVIDNNSNEDPTIFFKEKYPSVIYARTDKNIGFARGNNLGISLSKGQYIFFLNSDTVVPHDFFSCMVDFVQKNKNVGLVSPKVLFPDKKTIQYAGSSGINSLTGRGRRFGLNQIDHGQYDFVKSTALGHGGAMLVPKSVINKVGMMPECYFLYYEEHDWTQSILRGGYEIYYYGLTSIIHKESTSIGKRNPLKIKYLSRNRLLYLRRNVHGFSYYISLLFIFGIVVPTNILRYLWQGNFVILKAYLEGITSFIKC